MTLCPIALVATCSKCPVVGVCPLKEVVGDFVPEAKPEHDASKTQKQPLQIKRWAGLTPHRARFVFISFEVLPSAQSVGTWDAEQANTR